MLAVGFAPAMAQAPIQVPRAYECADNAYCSVSCQIDGEKQMQTGAPKTFTITPIVPNNYVVDLVEQNGRTEYCLNVALTVNDIETADRGSQRVVPSGDETIMLLRLAYLIVGSAVVAGSFSGTLFALNWWSGNLSYDPLFTASIPAAPPLAPDAVQDTALNALPKMESKYFRWAGVEHLNVQLAGGAPVVTGQPILRILTTQNGFHLLAGQFNGLNKNQVYRLTAWVKPEAGGNVQFEAYARGQPPNYAVAIFNLASHAVLSTDGAVKGRGVDLGPDGWQKVWLDLMTTEGHIDVAIRPANGGTLTYRGDGRLGVTLGGVEANSQG